MLPVCIILPVYNGIKYLQKSVISVLEQTFTNFEFLIIDDCSTDGSWEYLASLKDDRISLFRNETNSGLFFNLNFLIKKSNSPLIKIWSQDDVMYAHCIDEVIFFHNLHKEISFSYTAADYIDANGILMHSKRIDSTPEIVSTALHAKIACSTGSIAGNIANVAINKSILETVGLFNQGMKISGDFEMWVRLAKNSPIGFINKKCVQLRNHKEQLSGQEKYFIYHLREDIQAYKILFNYISPLQLAECRKLLRNNKLLFYYTLMLKAIFSGKFKTGYNFFKLLKGFDNFLLLSLSFFKRQIISKVH